jgi:glucose/arabinose dehydrogenase
LTPQTPQAPKSLAGKILRVDRDGKAATGNVGGEFDDRIYSYGHRNTQGIAFFAEPINDISGVSVEHGSGVDDEMNPLKPGNFGWAPPNGPYDESVPMTDKDRFPDAIDAIWSSGNPTQAPSGVAVLTGSQWKGWDGAVVMAMLKDEHLKVLKLDGDLKVVQEKQILQKEFGRLRAVVQGPDGSLYVTTSNSGDKDKIIKVTPK